jgi:hypothetical protein
MKNEAKIPNGLTHFVLNFVSHFSCYAFQLSDTFYWMILVMNYYFSTEDNSIRCTIFIQLIFRRFWDQNREADAVSVT